jgi:predicted metal-dependent phosphoesterase TrpH
MNRRHRVTATTTAITVNVTRADQAADPYFYVPIDVPAGTTRIDLTLSYRKAEDCIVDLGLFDPEAGPFPSSAGFRGWSGGARESVFVATNDATPGYIHGAIPAGRWRVVLGLYRVPVAGVALTLTYALDDTPRAVAPEPARTDPVRGGAGWYKGDLHCHTHHSDASGSPEMLHAAAIQVGLDFLAVSDHNTTSQWRYFHQASSPDLVFVRATEITTAAGHANVYGVDGFVDFRLTHPSDSHILSSVVRAKGGMLSINHDKPDIPWKYHLPHTDCMEVWQSSWLTSNWVSRDRYQLRLASGRRISAIGGSDFHQPEKLGPEGQFALARPTTVLWLDELSEAAVLAAMKAGRGFVTESPSGPHLSIEAGDNWMGSSVPFGPIEVSAEVRGAAGDELVWLDATGVVARQEIASDDWIGNWSGMAGKFLRAEIHARVTRERLLDEFLTECSKAGLEARVDPAELRSQPILRALSNPIYVDP